jgi:hypothetical protein
MEFLLVALKLNVGMLLQAKQSGDVCHWREEIIGYAFVPLFLGIFRVYIETFD